MSEQTPKTNELRDKYSADLIGLREILESHESLEIEVGVLRSRNGDLERGPWPVLRERDEACRERNELLNRMESLLRIMESQEKRLNKYRMWLASSDYALAAFTKWEEKNP